MKKARALLPKAILANWPPLPACASSWYLFHRTSTKLYVWEYKDDDADGIANFSSTVVDETLATYGWNSVGNFSTEFIVTEWAKAGFSFLVVTANSSQEKWVTHYIPGGWIYQKEIFTGATNKALVGPWTDGLHYYWLRVHYNTSPYTMELRRSDYLDITANVTTIGSYQNAAFTSFHSGLIVAADEIGLYWGGGDKIYTINKTSGDLTLQASSVAASIGATVFTQFSSAIAHAAGPGYAPVRVTANFTGIGIQSRIYRFVGWALEEPPGHPIAAQSNSWPQRLYDESGAVIGTTGKDVFDPFWTDWEIDCFGTSLTFDTDNPLGVTPNGPYLKVT